MERRHFLKLAFGFAAGGIALAASAQAAPLMPAPLADDAKLPVNPDAQPAVTSGEEVDRLTPEEVRWGRGRHRGWGRRRWGWRRRHWGGPPPLASQALGLASPPSLAPPLLASSSLLVSQGLPPGLFEQGIKKAPRERGFYRALENVSERGDGRNAARCRQGSRGRGVPPRPAPPPRGATTTDAAIGLAAAIGATMPPRAAPAAASAALKLATVPKAKTAAKRYFMFVSRFWPQWRHGTEYTNS